MAGTKSILISALISSLFTGALVLGGLYLYLDNFNSGEVVKNYYFNDTLAQNEIITEIFQDNKDSVVYITVSTSSNISDHPDIPASGTGIIIDNRGYILTNEHVVSNAQDISVVLPSGEEFPARKIGTDPMTDLAVIKVDTLTNLKPAKLGDSSGLRAGEIAIAIGNPFRLENTITLGVISGLDRNITTSSNYKIRGIIQTDAAINPGNSGGPLINHKGEVIGVNTAIFSTSEGFQGVGFAVPINTAKEVSEQIIQKGKVLRPWMGIQGRDFLPIMAENLNITLIESGALVVSVEEEGPSSGILRGTNGQPEDEDFQLGDVIVGMEDREIKNMDDLINVILGLKINEDADIEIYRDGEVQTVTITLGERPEDL